MFADSLCLCRGPAHVKLGGCIGRRQHYVSWYICRDPPVCRLSWRSDCVAHGRVFARDIMYGRACSARVVMPRRAADKIMLGAVLHWIMFAGVRWLSGRCQSGFRIGRMPLIVVVLAPVGSMPRRHINYAA